MPQPPEVDAVRAELQVLYEQVWSDLSAQLADLAADPLRREALRRRLRGLQASVEQAMAELDVHAREWLSGRFPAVYQLGAMEAAAATGRPFTWAAPHRAAVQVLAADTFDDLLAATRFVRRDTKRFVREAARQRTAASVVGGDTAVKAGRDLAGLLEERFGARGPAAVVYRNGARHGLADYADTVIRTRTATTFTTGTLNQSAAAGVQFMECSDGAGCGLSSHDDPNIANGQVFPIDVANSFPLAHPRCARAWLARPDITHPAAAARADRFTDSERQQAAADERARVAAAPSGRLRRQRSTPATRRTARRAAASGAG